jgi:hypothetical protein
MEIVFTFPTKLVHLAEGQWKGKNNVTEIHQLVYLILE